MTGDELLIYLRVLIEETAYPPWDRATGNQPPLTNEQWDTILDRVLLLAQRNWVRT